MALTGIHHDAFEVWLKKKGLRKQCTFCRSQSLVAANVVHSPMAATTMNRANADGFAGPMIQVNCNDCGHVMLFAADRVLGEADFKSLFPGP